MGYGMERPKPTPDVLQCKPVVAVSCFLVVSNQAVSEGNQLGDDMEDRVVSTPSGQLQGHDSAKNASIRVFRGVPYAKPPVGEARFSPPQPIAPWEGVRDATRDPLPCWQAHSEDAFVWSRGVFDRSEDCLLYTSPSPRDQRGSRMPSSA